jgi:hypothetical protein
VPAAFADSHLSPRAITPTEKTESSGVTIMNPVMSFKDYFAALKGRENDGASLSALLGPFQIPGLPTTEDEFLLVGHVLDAIADEKPEKSAVDASFVLELALDLGLSAA